MKKQLKFLTALLLCSLFLSAQQDSSDLKWFNHIKLGAFAGFKAYGLENGYRQLKDQGFSRMYFAEINIADHKFFGKHNIYGEFIHQPMMNVVPQENLSLDFVFFRYNAIYEVFVRSIGFNLGYSMSYEVFPKWEIGTKFGLGRTYFEVREYVTPTNTMETETYNSRDTMMNAQMSLFTSYTLHNNIGFFAEAALAMKVPVFRLGFT